MSLSTASLAHEREDSIPPSYAQGDSDDDGTAYARNGSVVAKLFGKNRRQVAVGSTDHLNSDQDASADESDGNDDAHANGNGRADVDDEDDDEEEYVPTSDEDGSGESDDDDADVGDLDDEETSMRSLLLPMATYAKQLLFLNDEDEGEFDEQDAELWESPQEKRAWIERYEAHNRTYIENYGCRIDAPAIPESKKRLRRERSREAKYSLVLLALALAYLIRLLVGPPAISTAGVGGPGISQSPLSPPFESVVEESATTPQAAHEWTSSSPPWWTAWTEELVGRAFAWPQSWMTSWQSSHSPRSSKDRDQQSDSSFTPSVASPEMPNPSLVAPDGIIDDEAATAPPPLESQKDDIDRSEIVPSGSVQDTGFNPVLPPFESDMNQQHSAPIDTLLSPSSSVHTPENDETSSGEIISADAVEGEAGAGATAGSTSGPTTSTALLHDSEERIPSKVVSSDDVQTDDPTQKVEVSDAKTASDSYKRCLDMFYMLVKMKHDASVKVAAVVECDQAVESYTDSVSTQWIQARLLRGDLKSLLQLFREAHLDYETALSGDEQQPVTLRPEIEIKIASNRWIEYYHTKRFKELRNDCQRIRDTAPTPHSTTTPDRVRELAVEWLRAFRKEITVLDVLTKTRAWTLYRPPILKTNNH